MKKQQPFMPLFFGDFLASTAEWGGEDQALYLLLLGHQWSLGSLPIEPEKLRKLVRFDRKTFAISWPNVREKFVERDGRLYNERLEEHRCKVVEKSVTNAEAGKRGAAKRWNVDSERHHFANGEPIANAIETPMAERHPKSDGEPDSNPTYNQNDEEEEEPSRTQTSTLTLSSTPASEADAARAPATLLPEAWQPNAINREWLEQAGLTPQQQADIVGEFTRFARHSKLRKVNWDRTFSGNPVVKTAVGRARSGASNAARGYGSSSRPSAVERVYAATADVIGDGNPGSKRVALDG